MKENSKIINIVSFVIVLVLEVVIYLAICWHSKWVYVLILLCACALLLFEWHEKMNILKFWAIIMVIYSPMVLLGPKLEVWKEAVQGNLPVILLLIVAEMFAMNSAKIVIVLGVISLILFKLYVKAVKITILNKIYGPLPSVSGIVKRDKKVYFHKDLDTKNVQLIYRQGHRKKILDTYPRRGEDWWDFHYSLEWNDEKKVIVRCYNVEEHKLMMEKEVMLPRN